MTIRRLMLLGGGHAHVHVLARAGRTPFTGVELVLVSPSARHHDSGMVPGYLQGTYDEPDLAFDLRAIASRAGARFVEAAAERVDVGVRTVEVAGERRSRDMLSVDVGSEPAGLGIPGVVEHALSVRPMNRALALRQCTGDLFFGGRNRSISVVVVGAGAAGVEVALALERLGRMRASRPEVTLVEAEPRRVRLDDGSHEASELTVWLAGAAPAALLARSDVPKDARGLLLVDGTPRAIDGTPVFGAGDCIWGGTGRGPLPPASERNRTDLRNRWFKGVFGMKKVTRAAAWKPEDASIQLRVGETSWRRPGVRRPVFVFALFFLLKASGTSAAPARIVTASALAEALSATRRTPVVLDARPSGDFQAGHVPGSLPVDWRDFSESRPGVASWVFGNAARWGLLAADRTSVRDRLRALGVSASRPVVVVGAPSGWGEEGRIAWTLLYLGLGDVALLDAGFPAWAAKFPERIETGGPRPPPPGDFTPAPQPDRRIHLDALRAAVAAGQVTLLDARTAGEFAGERARGQKRGGRIPGARLVAAAALRTADGRYIEGEALTKLTGSIKGCVPVVTYCTAGVRSALLAILLEARLGIVAANYDGSMWEWSASDDLPLETGP